MQFGRTFGNRLARDVDAFLDGMRVGTFLPRTFVKAAKFAVCDADIRVIKMPVDVVIRRQAVLAATNVSASLPSALRSVVV